VGIAVGYSSNILPRKPDEVEAYLAGDFSKKLKPYFKGFKGKISQVDGLRSAWLLEGEFVANKSARTIEIQSLSPLSRYDTFITKLGLILESKGVDYRIENRSKEEVEVLIKLKCSDEQFDDVATRVKKETQKIVTENIVLVKDGLVMEYDNIQEYLDQFRVHREEVIYKRIVKDLYYNDRELAFQEAKLKFLVFMQAKKRINDEIVEFLKQYESWIKTRLEAIALVRLSEKEIEATKSRIEELKSNAIVLKKSIKEQGDKWQGIKKAWEKATKSKPKQSALVATSSTDTFNGIEIWNPEEAIEEDVEESVEGDETNEN
jgi:DNA gyrase/topoisomerase IV subunit A